MPVPPGLSAGPILLDYNATTPVDPRVMEACLPYLTQHFGNPSSGHAYGQAALAAITAARAQLAALLDAEPDEFVFTGGGSDSDTLAIRGGALAHRHRGDHLITQRTEHPGVLGPIEALHRLHGFRVTYLSVDRDGLVDPHDLADALTDRTVLVSIMHANNETGTIQPIHELASIAHEREVLFHTDASQSPGKVELSVRDLGVDLLTITGHKMYAPKGVGALYVRAGLDLEPTVCGGGQERGRRGGTENVALIVALGEAARLALDTRESTTPSLTRLRDVLHDRLRQGLPGRVHLNGHPTRRLPNTLNVSIDGTTGPELLAGTPEVAASTGSACHEGTTEPSPVLAAMGISAERARAALRITLGRWTTEDDVVRAVDRLAETASTLAGATARPG